jgi:hypothetical protein
MQVLLTSSSWCSGGDDNDVVALFTNRNSDFDFATQKLVAGIFDSAKIASVLSLGGSFCLVALLEWA